MKTVQKAKLTSAYSLPKVCFEYGLTRDAYYKYQHRYMRNEQVKTTVINLVKERRTVLPREGGKKLYVALHDKFISNSLKVGRDRLFDILREENMLIKRKKAYHKTTNSYHHFHK